MASTKGYALLTGGTGGIGYELAKLLAADGYDLILVARGEAGLVKTARELEMDYQREVVTYSKDLSIPQNAFELAEEVKARGVVVEVLVNDAGQGLYCEFVETDLQREQAIEESNISSMLILTKTFLKGMVARGRGMILNMASVAGMRDMNSDTSFPLSLDFGGKHYAGTITPSVEKGRDGMPVYFRVTIGDELWAYLCCGDNGWRERDGSSQPSGLVSAIGNYILEYYE